MTPPHHAEGRGAPPRYVQPSDCYACPMEPHCTAHNRDGEWDHTKGERPCQPVPEGWKEVV